MYNVSSVGKIVVSRTQTKIVSDDPMGSVFEVNLDKL